MAATVVTSDEYTGPLDAGATLIQDDWLTPELTPGPGGSPVYTEVNTSTSGGAALAVWLQAQYDGGAVPGDFVFLRVSVDAAPTDWFRYAIASADSTTLPTPVLTLNKIELPPVGTLVEVDGRRRSIEDLSIQPGVLPSITNAGSILLDRGTGLSDLRLNSLTWSLRLAMKKQSKMLSLFNRSHRNDNRKPEKI